ncbi:MAG: A/G-specific adenine glycosylase [Chitinophagales bacterium]|nr:A/G-specific adenine glycosylase [Chitinophagales bacterium]
MILDSKIYDLLQPKQFAALLLAWSRQNVRDLPWKADRDPYKIWLSEIILQQTRVQQGMPYYLRFIKTYPDIHTLASASENQIIKSWEGLGYYTRARNLHKAAKIVSDQYNGIFPQKYTDLLALPGIGPYSAAAIASFAYDEAVPVIDGNVLRVIARLLGSELPIDTQAGKNLIQTYVEAAILEAQPSLFNQAIMDFGATHCKPIAPLCDQCPFAEKCVARLQRKTALIPIKKQKIKKTLRHVVYLEFYIAEKYTLLQRQNTDDIWKGMYLFPVLAAANNDLVTAVKKMIFELFGENLAFNIHKALEKPLKQILTHRVIYADFYQVYMKTKPQKINKNFNLVERVKIQNFAMPKILTNYLKLINH